MDTYILGEIREACRRVKEGEESPDIEKYKNIDDLLSRFIHRPYPNKRMQVLVCKYYDKDGNVLKTLREDTVTISDGQMELENMWTNAENSHPQGTEYCKIFASYNGRNFDPKPVVQFEVYDLDMTIPDETEQ